MQPRKIRLGYDKISDKLVAPIQRPLLTVAVAHDEEISPRASVRERSPTTVIGLPLLAAERGWLRRLHWQACPDPNPVVGGEEGQIGDGDPHIHVEVDVVRADAAEPRDFPCRVAKPTACWTILPVR
jgi:hypothetical protein